MAGTLKEWALKYAEMGLAVFPLKPRDKSPATTNGFKSATTDKDKIAAWWDKNPDSNIGIATGSMSGGVFVVDLDVHKDGENGMESLAAWEAENGELPETCQALTGGGGIHLFYKDFSLVKCRTGLYPGIDIKGDGGYIVAPPSVHPDGGRYEWEAANHIEDVPIAQADSRVFKFLNPIPEEKENQQGFRLDEKIPEGGRTNAMIRLIGSLKGKGLDAESIKAAVKKENEKKCVPPLTDQELEKHVFPALERGWKVEKPYTEGSVSPGHSSAPKREITYTDADDLIAADLPPAVFLVEGILTPGLGGLSAKSKLGKSWMSLQLSVDLALGDKFLGFTTKQCGVLYIDLENTEALTQERLRIILDGREPPKKGNLIFAHDFNRMGEGLEEDLVKFLEKNRHVKFVVIDVFQKVKQGKQPGQTDYEADYEILTKLKRIADGFGVCIFLIYHDRKFVDPTDPHSNTLGSTAIMGVSDFLWSLSKEKREDKEATLSITGRTVMDNVFKLRRNGAKWENLGNAAALEETRKRREYDQDPVVNTIKRLVEQNGGKWRGRVKEIISSSQYFKGCRIYGTSQKVGNQIKKRLEDMEKYDSICHYEIENGSGGATHVFESENPFLEETLN